MSNADWITVDRRNPCPICEKQTWCVVSVDGNSAICMRTLSAKKITFDRTGDVGFLHRLTDDHPVPRTPRRQRKVPDKLGFQQVERLCAEYEARLTREDVLELAYGLGVTQESLRSLRVGKLRRGVYTFPMSDARKRPIGIRMRSEGKKWAEPGSQNGLFVPDEMLHEGPLYVVEGPTDAAAVYDLGLDVVGRPSCSACDEMVAGYCARRDVVIVADADDHEAGYRGALKLAIALIRVTLTTKIVTPVGAKDSRSWIANGATRELFDMMAEQATSYRRGDGAELQSKLKEANERYRLRCEQKKEAKKSEAGQ